MEEKIKVLLNKYYNGETTLDEERLLKQFFAKNIVPESLEADKELFLVLAEKHHTDDLAIEQGIWLDVEKWKNTEIKRKRFYNRLAVALSSAATIAIAIGLTFFLIQQNQTEKYVDTFEDPQLALQETQRVLALVGSKIADAKHGLQPLNHLQKPADSFRSFSKVAESMDYFSKIESISKPEELPYVGKMFKVSETE
ncbi:MAG TPA: hypothetical protein PLV65_04320 [Tenuifilaceae bacterium]|nr:hypothetical protein [Tenuifilaceae bacterium]